MSQAAKVANAALREHALTYPEAWEDHPWGGTVVKVRKKIFCFLEDAPGKAERVLLTVKLDDSEAQALDLEGAEPSGYGLGKHGWVTLRLEAEDMPGLDVLKAYIDESYRAVAPKTLVKRLDA